MNLSSAGAIANQSLGAVSNQISVVSRNISGVNTPGYSAKTALLSTIPRSRQNPKIRGFDDAEIVGDRIA